MNNNETIQHLIAQMSLVEKIGQLQQTSYFSDVITGSELDTSETLQLIRDGKIGSILSVHDVKILRELQRLAVEESRLGIPLFFAFDVIHGYRTAFPINLALACSFDPLLIEQVATASAFEASHSGMHLTFSPMVDIVRDPRWGRVMESNGEDPFLSSVLAAAYVKGYQGKNLHDDGTLAACVKHFAGYGFSEAGRDYNTVDISNRQLFTTILPPFRAAIDAGVAMVMTGFNVLFDRPATANDYLLQDVLRQQLQFQGVIISDYSSTEELMEHKVASTIKEVAYQCFSAGIDHEMGATSFQTSLASLVQEGEIALSDIDAAVHRLLTLKQKLGLFADPYRRFYHHHERFLLTEETKQVALDAAQKSIILLKNSGILPCRSDKRFAVVGPFATSQDLIGEWPGLAKKEEVISLADAFLASGITVDVFPTLDDVQLASLDQYDLVVVTLGENGNEAGEGYSKVDLSIKKEQLNMFDYCVSNSNHVLAVVFAGRPLIITDIDKKAQAILYAFQPGTQAGLALVNLITGVTSPSAKCAMTFPSHQGQIPLYYNHFKTGRPIKLDDPMYRYRTHYIDHSNEPLYPFGYGLHYGVTVLSSMSLSRQEITPSTSVVVRVQIENQSGVTITEVVQCYIEALTYSVARPVNELKSFQRVNLLGQQNQTIEFELHVEDFKSYNIDMIWTAENRDYLIKVGTSSKTVLTEKIHIKD